MRIDYITLIPLNVPNAPAHHVLARCKAFARLGHEVTLIHTGPRLSRDAASGWLARDISLPLFHFRGGGDLYRFLLRRTLQQRLREGPPDLLYFRFPPGADSIVRFLQRVHVTKVLELNGYEVIDLPGFLPLVDAMDLVVVPSEELRRIAAERTDRSSKFALHLSPATDVSIFQPMDRDTCRRRLGLSIDPVLLLHVSGFQEHHDFDTMKQALQALNAASHDGDHGSGPRYRLLLLGDGARRSVVEKEFTDLVRQGAAIFTGSVSQERLAEYMGAADVCLSPVTAKSLIDGNLRGYKIYEYACCARPSVVTVDFANEVASWARDSFALIPPEDPEAICDAIRDILDHPDRWAPRVEQGRKYVLENRSSDAAARSTLATIAAHVTRSP